MNVKLENRARKQLDRLDAMLRTRLLMAIKGLNKEPPEGDIKKMHGGRADYRLRSGDYRIFFDILKDRISVTRIATRGQAYKRKG